MFNDKVKEAITRQGLGSFTITKEPRQPEPMSPEAQKLLREARIYRVRANELDNQAAVVHGNKRRMKLRREARVSHDLADRYIEEAEAIAHYGRPGMKWGVRRSKKQLGAAKKAGTSTKKLQKQAQKMSNEQLQSRVKRLNLQKQYVSLNKQANTKTKSRMSRGKKEVSQILKVSARKAITKETTNQMSKALSKAIEKNVASRAARAASGTS